MKITKIDHIRPGVSVMAKGTDGSGLLYKPMPNGQKYILNNTKKLHSHILKRVESAQILYNVLNTNVDFCVDKDMQEEYRKIVSNINNIFNSIFFSESSNLKKKEGEVPSRQEIEKATKQGVSFVKTLDTMKIKTGSKKDETGKRINIKTEGRYLKIDNCDDKVKILVTRNLRGTLRKDVVYKVNGEEVRRTMRDCMTEVCTAFCGSKEAKDLSWNMLFAFFKIVNEDYFKFEEIGKIETSITHQTTKTLPIMNDSANNQSAKLITLSNSTHDKKKYVFDYLKEYAGSDENGKIALQHEMKKLIMLYVFGKDGYSGLSWETAMYSEEEFLSGLEKSKERIRDLKKEIWELKQKEETTEIKQSLFEKQNELRNERTSQKERTEQKHFSSFRTARDFLKDDLKIISDTKAGSSKEMFWLSFIDKTARKLEEGVADRAFLNNKGYLCRHIWKEWTQLIASKYIDMGKAVYHFAIPECMTDGNAFAIKEIREEYKDGITSFDFERIKAKESLDREMAQYIAFAANNFASSCTTKEDRLNTQKDDILSMKLEGETTSENETEVTLRNDAARRILQYFGGKSSFEGIADIENISKEELFKNIRDNFSYIRNNTFHYVEGDKENKIDSEIPEKFLNHETAILGEMIQKKYYSNNVDLFYSEDTIIKLLDDLYSKEQKRYAQVPSFGKIIARGNVRDIIGSKFYGKQAVLTQASDEDTYKMFWSSVYFVLKEIYYHDYLQNADLKTRFLHTMMEKKERDDNLDKRNKDRLAMEKFVLRLVELGVVKMNFKSKKITISQNDKTFAEICQGLMIELMLQNNSGQKVEKKSDEKEVYGFYRSILYEIMREDFAKYLSENWSCLKTISQKKEKGEEKDFLKGYAMTTTMYSGIASLFEADNELYGWYMMAHFMNPKHLNHLIGSIRNYIQFTTDIEKRAKSIGDRVTEESKITETIRGKEALLKVFEFVLEFCGHTTEKATDYFESEEEYAVYLSEFIDFEPDTKSGSMLTGLSQFCDKKLSNSGMVTEIYRDGANIKPNRNIFLSVMYGGESVLKGNIKKITHEEIDEYYVLKKDLKSVFNSEKGPKNKKEQEKLRAFQNAKNRIELLDIEIYSEIVNEMQSQLLNWIYLRERDLMYYQLGYHYTKLFWTNSIPENDKRRQLKVKGKFDILDGAILYEIMALYSAGLPILICENEKWKAKASRAWSQKKIDLFKKGFEHGAEIYNEALDLFENTDEKEENVKTRNYIEHFAWYTSHDKSMLELYSEVYDRMFRYSTNLRKSVSYVIENILARFFVEASLYMGVGEKTIGGKVHKRTIIQIRKDGLKSRKLTFNLKVNEKQDNKGKGKMKKTEKGFLPVEVDARSKVFMEQIADIISGSSENKL